MDDVRLCGGVSLLAWRWRCSSQQLEPASHSWFVCWGAYGVGDTYRILRAIGRVLFEQNALKDAGDAFERALSIDKRVSTTLQPRNGIGEDSMFGRCLGALC